MRAVALVLPIALAGCTPVLNASLLRNESAVSQDRDAPELALLHYRLVRDARNGNLADATVCTGIGQGETAQALGDGREARLMGVIPWVAPFARCALQADKARRDSITGDKAILLDVHDLVCSTTDNCTAWSGAREYGWSYYRLRYVEGEWRITEEPLGIVLT